MQAGRPALPLGTSSRAEGKAPSIELCLPPVSVGGVTIVSLRAMTGAAGSASLLSNILPWLVQ